MTGMRVGTPGWICGSVAPVVVVVVLLVLEPVEVVPPLLVMVPVELVPVLVLVLVDVVVDVLVVADGKLAALRAKSTVPPKYICPV